MTPESAVSLVNQSLMTAFWICLPLLAVGFFVGMLINLVQIVTSLQDASFSTIPRLAAFFLALTVLTPYIVGRLMAYTSGLLGDLSRYAR